MEYASEGKEHISKKVQKDYGSLSSDDASKVNPEIDIDKAFELVGSYGRFQILLHFLVIYLVCTFGYYFVLAFFIGDDPPWKCTTQNSSAFCMKYHGLDISKDNELFYERCKLKRDDWTYTTTKSYSFVTEYDLVCNKTTTAAFTSSSFYMGGLLGSLFSGTLADTFGRKIVIIFSLAITTCFSIGCTFSGSILQLSVLRGIMGAAHVACYFTAFVYLSEFASPKYRTITVNMYVMALTVSQLLLDLVAYFERDWRNLELYVACPCVIALIGFLFMPESPRWLLATKKWHHAKIVLERIATFNGHSAMEIRLKELPYEKKYSYVDLLRSCEVVTLTFVIGALWMTIAVLYYTAALDSSSFGGNMYLTFALLAFADFPSFFLSFYTCNKFGRKKSNLVCMAIGGILVGCIALVPQKLTYKYKIIIVIIILAKFFVEMSFNGIYTWTVELFPTVLRSQGLSVCVIFERLGLIAVPFLTTVLQSVNFNLPFIFMCCLAILASIIGLTLPETNKKPTREKYDDFFETDIPYEKIGNEEFSE